MGQVRRGVTGWPFYFWLSLKLCTTDFKVRLAGATKLKTKIGLSGEHVTADRHKKFQAKASNLRLKRAKNWIRSRKLSNPKMKAKDKILVGPVQVTASVVLV